MNGKVIGPYELSLRLTAEINPDFYKNQLAGLLENVCSCKMMSAQLITRYIYKNIWMKSWKEDA